MGSVEGNVGHLGAASGVVALIKTVLSLWHAEIFPTANHEEAHPGLGLDDGRLCVASGSARPWHLPHGRRSRVAGVTALGAGGTNVHAILAEGRKARSTPDARNPTTDNDETEDDANTEEAPSVADKPNDLVEQPMSTIYESSRKRK